jgi:hypothetical protein
MDLACPKCASSEVRKLSLIYNEGLSTINTQSMSAGSAFGSGGGMAFGTSSTSTTGRQQTALSKEAAPPAKKLWPLWAALGGILALMGIGGLRHSVFEGALYIGMAAYSIQRALRGREFNTAVLPGLLAKWNASFLCNRCGEKFVAA